MKQKIAIILFLSSFIVIISSCLYTTTEDKSYSSLSSQKNEIRLYPTQEMINFLEQLPLQSGAKEVEIEMAGKILDNTHDTTYTFSDIKVKIHGEGTARRERRKSLSVKLPDSERYFNFPYQEKEFFLIAMAEDSGYINNLLGYTFLKEINLFPNHFELTHLYYNDIYQGMYLLVEKSKNAIRNNNGGITSIFRRNYGPSFEMVYQSDQISDTKSTAENKRLKSMYTISQKLSGRAFSDSLSRIIDMREYAKWLAINALLRNGDYLDEIFFYGQQTSDKKSISYKIAAWDYDDLFKPPHWGHDYKNSFIYCNEDPLDVKFGTDGDMLEEGNNVVF